MLVDGGQRAVIFDRIQGVKRTVKGEGLHVLIPWLQQAILFDVRTKPRSITSTTGSRDMQTVSLTLRVLSRPDCEHLPDIYTKLGTDYDERVLPSIANEVLKAIVAQFNAGELITQRELVTQTQHLAYVGVGEDPRRADSEGRRLSHPPRGRLPDAPQLWHRLYQGGRGEADRAAGNRNG